MPMVPNYQIRMFSVKDSQIENQKSLDEIIKEQVAREEELFMPSSRK